MEVVTGSGSKDDECVMVEESDKEDLASSTLDLKEGINKGKVDGFGRPILQEE